MKVLTLVLIMTLSAPTLAKMYKCKVDGGIIYQQTKCNPGEGRELKINHKPSRDITYEDVIKDQLEYEAKIQEVNKNLAETKSTVDDSYLRLESQYEEGKISYDNYLFQRNRIKRKFDEIVKATEEQKEYLFKAKNVKKDYLDFKREMGY